MPTKSDSTESPNSEEEEKTSTDGEMGQHR